LPDFNEILRGEAVFTAFGNGTDTGTRVLQNVFFVFLMQFGPRRAAAFVSSPIHLLNQPLRLTQVDHLFLGSNAMNTNAGYTLIAREGTACSTMQWTMIIKTFLSTDYRLSPNGHVGSEW